MNKLPQAKYIFKLLKFAFNNNPLLYLSVLISILSIGIELLAMASLLPLFELVSGETVDKHGLISKALIILGFTVDAASLLQVFFLLFTLRVVTQLFSQSLTHYLGRRVMAQLGSRAFEKIITSMSIDKISEKSIGFFMGLAGDESFRASTLVVALTQFVATFLLGVMYFISIAIYSLYAAEMIFILMLVSAVFFIWILKISHKMGVRQIEGSRKANSIFMDAMNNIKAVRSLSSEKYVAGLYRRKIFTYANILFYLDAINLATKLVPIIFLLLGSLALILSGWVSVENLGMAYIVSLIAYLMRFFPVVGQSITLAVRIVADAKSGKDVTELVSDESAESANSDNYLHKIDTIKIDNLSFSYRDVQGVRPAVLNSVYYEFEKNNSYALVGKSGLGKSTLLDVLLKFYPPASGSISIDGISTENIPGAHIRHSIVLINQEPAIFDDTVYNNICMGETFTLEDVKWACELACISKDVESLAQGYETRLQYQGKNLSGGQRQRIAIARALVRKPNVLILDESTTALDKATQEIVIRNLMNEYENKIIIFVSHDPYIMSQVDHTVDLALINKV
ncbi:ATP-binding cassette domain-containing protein [Methylobacillus glycogenes]|uniref:ATP-binding cassette domain-containing protein n=1 Tax=Methylobacillus glycogenes TaxID=406 RepID=UPI000470B652|nr:ABC transporter ATP-binding protein [Methylobacillus glycogenes]